MKVRMVVGCREISARYNGHAVQFEKIFIHTEIAHRYLQIRMLVCSVYIECPAGFITSQLAGSSRRNNARNLTEFLHETVFMDNKTGIKRSKHRWLLLLIPVLLSMKT